MRSLRPMSGAEVAAVAAACRHVRSGVTMDTMFNSWLLFRENERGTTSEV
jgi:hypothetical protein